MSKRFKYHQSYQEEGLISKTVVAAGSFYGLREANLYFCNLCDSQPEFVQLANKIYRYRDCYIQVGKRYLMAGRGECLMGLNRLELFCLPQGIALIWLDNGEDMVLITRIKGSEGQRLIPYSEGSPRNSEKILLPMWNA